MQKTCTACGVIFDKNYRDTYCPQCRSNYQLNRFIALKLKAVEYLGGCCKRCGLDGVKYYYLIDFDHRDQTQKELSWNKLRKLAWDAITEELDKCDPLCSNCHRIRHHEEWAEEQKPIPHGTNHAYSYYYCRCDACKAAHAAAKRRE